MLIDIVFLHHCVSIGQWVRASVRASVRKSEWVSECVWCQCDVTIIIKLSCASVIQLILKFWVSFGPEYFPLANTHTQPTKLIQPFASAFAAAYVCVCARALAFLNVCLSLAFHVCVWLRLRPYPSTCPFWLASNIFWSESYWNNSIR